MERHNYKAKAYKNFKTIIVIYIIAIVAILICPFFVTRQGANIPGYEIRESYFFSAAALVALIVFLIPYIKYEMLEIAGDIKSFNWKLPAIVAVGAALVFIFGGDMMIKHYLQYHEWSMWDILFTPTKLAFMGPFVYCACLAVNTYLTIELNGYIDKVEKGQL